MEYLEQEAITTASLDCKPKLWKRYVDDILEVVKVGQTQQLTDHINTIDSTGSIKFTFEEQENNSIPFLDTLIIRKPDNTVKLVVYRKKTHTDQYLHCDSHHPLQHKLGVIRTLTDRAECIVTEKEDKIKEVEHVKKVLGDVGYKDWMFRKVSEDKARRAEGSGARDKGGSEKSKGMVVIPYVQGLSEAYSRVCRKYDIQTAMRPHMTLRNLLVKPKDQIEKMENTGVVYKVKCKGCDKVYVGETARQLRVRIGEHQKDVNTSCNSRKYTRSARKESESVFNKSALTDHVMQENHVIDWDDVDIMDRARDKERLRIRESIWIRREGPGALNRDDGNHQLPGAYTTLLTD